MGVHPVGFVYQHGDIPAVGDPHDFRQISGDSVIRRIDEKDRFGIRVLPQGAFHVFDVDPVGDAQLLVHHRMDKQGVPAGQDDGGQHPLVYVPRYDNFVAGRTDGKDHGHDRSAGTLDGEKCIIGAEGLRSQLLGLLNGTVGMVQIIQRCDVDQVDGQGALSHEIAKLGIHPLSFFVPGNVELERFFCGVFLQLCKQRCTMLSVVQWGFRLPFQN